MYGKVLRMRNKSTTNGNSVVLLLKVSEEATFPFLQFLSSHKYVCVHSIMRVSLQRFHGQVRYLASRS